MALETSIRDALLADASVSALVGKRIFAWQRAENSIRPAVVWRTIIEEAKQGLSTSQDLSESTIEYECVADSLAEARTIAEAIRQALAGTIGALGDVEHLALRHTTTRDAFTDPFDASAAGVFAVTVEITALFRTASIA